MARIAGVDLPKNKRVVIGLTYIYGIGVSGARKILDEAGVDENIRVHQLTDDQAGESIHTGIKHIFPIMKGEFPVYPLL